MGPEDRGPGVQVPVATLAPDTTLFDLDEIRDGETRRSGSLVVIAGNAADVGTHVAALTEVVIGRVGSGLVLRDGRISRQHARVWCDSSRWLVEDCGSTNGTALNGRALDRPTPLGDGDKIYLGGTVIKFTLVDATEAAYLERMARLAGTDPLTGLHAKHRFDGMLDEALRVVRLSGMPMSVLMMDMDGLKAINDTHGHRMGAHTISLVGGLIGRIMEGRGAACRFGGDEFSAFTLLGTEDAFALAEEIRAGVEAQPYVLDDVQVQASISIGIADRTDETRAASLIEAADAALYRAKAAGRNRVSR